MASPRAASAKAIVAGLSIEAAVLVKIDPQSMVLAP
jgi:hypothetical protein